MWVIKSISLPTDKEFMKVHHSGRGIGGGIMPPRSGNSITAFRGSYSVLSYELHLGGQVDISLSC